MIEAGTCFCYKCGNVFKDAYYKSGIKSVGVKLKHGTLRKNTWDIEPVIPNGVEMKPENTPTLVGVTGGEDSIPDSIMCRFGEEKTPLEMRRCCPICKEDTELPVDCGKYPTFVIALVGRRAIGKSVWLTAISTSRNLEKVNQVSVYPYRLDFIRKENIYDAPASTNPGSAGKTNYLRIIEQKTGQIVASVILLDAAGELFDTISQADNPLRKFLLGNGSYTGVDALIYVESAMAQISEILTKEDLELSKKAYNVYAEMEQANALHGKPIAYICTHTDQMMKQKRRIPKIRDISGEFEFPLYSEATFKPDTSYEPNELLARIVQEDIIARALQPDVLVGADHTRRGFLLQSCSNRKLDDGTIFNDMGKNFNLMDPLIWILNALRLFPIPQK